MLRRMVAAAEFILILPAAVFMAALMVRSVIPLPNEPALAAQRIVMWYAHLPVRVGLWGLLGAMPLAVVILGCSTLVSSWRSDAALQRATRQTVTALRAHWTAVWIAVATLGAAGILAVVGVHVLTD